MSSGATEPSAATWYSTFCNPRRDGSPASTNDVNDIKVTRTENRIHKDLQAIYKAQPLKQPRHYLRLLKLLPNLTSDHALQCTLELVDARWSEEYQYNVISYSRDRSAAAKVILINGRRTSIPEQLWSCFDALRLDNSRGYLWIEDLCVDRSNVTDRNHHAIKMDRIIRQAMEVIIWLGGGAYENSQAIPAMKRAVKLHGEESREGSDQPGESQRQLINCSRCALCAPDHVVQLEAIQNMLTHPYWSQLESVQEVMLSTKLTLHFGSHITDRQTLREFLALSSRGEAHIRSITQTEQVRHVSGLSQDWTWLISHGAPLPDIIAMFAAFGDCEDPRDRVYRLLSLVRPAHRIEVDYSLRPDEVFGRLLDQLVLCTDSRAYGEKTDAALLVLAEQLGVPRRWQQSTLDVPDLRKQLALLIDRGLLVKRWRPCQVVELATRAYERDFGGDLDAWIEKINTIKDHVLPPSGPGNADRAIELLIRML